MPKLSVQPGEGARIALMTRTTKDLRSKLESAASESGRSLGQEVEYRLDRSFLESDLRRIVREELVAVFREGLGNA